MVARHSDDSSQAALAGRLAQVREADRKTEVVLCSELVLEACCCEHHSAMRLIELTSFSVHLPLAYAAGGQSVSSSTWSASVPSAVVLFLLQRHLMLPWLS